MKPTSASTIVTTNTTMPRCRAACMFTRLSWQTWLTHGCLNDERVRPNSTVSATESIVRSATTTHTIIRQLGLATSCGGLRPVGSTGRWRFDTTVYRGNSLRILRPLDTTVCEVCYGALRHSGAGTSPEFMTTKHLTSKQNMTAAVIKGTYPYGVATWCSIFNVASLPSSRIWTVCDVGARIDMLSRLQPACCAKDLAVLSRECDKLLLESSCSKLWA